MIAGVKHRFRDLGSAKHNTQHQMMLLHVSHDQDGSLDFGLHETVFAGKVVMQIALWREQSCTAA